MIGVTVNDPVMVEQWIAAARESGADNRWELSARTRVAIWRQDWEELGRVANLVGGDRGAMLRGMAAARQGSWPEARQHLLDSLRTQGRLEDGGAALSQAQALVELGWVEQQLGLAAGSRRWRMRASRSSACSSRVAATARATSTSCTFS
jgi:hypothetical protein